MSTAKPILTVTTVTTPAKDVPGPSGVATNPMQVGHVLVSAATCQPEPVVGTVGFLLGCAGQFANTGTSDLSGSAQAVTTQGTPMSETYTFTLKPGDSFGLATPPTGSEWLVVDLTAGQVAGITWGILGGLGLLGGFSLYGMYSAGSDLVRSYRKKHPKGGKQ